MHAYASLNLKIRCQYAASYVAVAIASELIRTSILYSYLKQENIMCNCIAIIVYMPIGLSTQQC